MFRLFSFTQKKHIMKRILFALMLSSLFFTSCKDDAAPTCTLNSASLAGTYRITASTYQVNAQSSPVDDYATWPACEKDDLYIFNVNGTFSLNESNQVCNPSSAFDGNWFLSGSILSISVAGFAESGSVSSFTCNSFKLVFVDDTTGEIVTSTLTRL